MSLNNIILLDEITASRIAAGEVVERPVSVVKELVENSLDAGAGRIVVDLEEGGLATITVVDDGAGIKSGDLPLALERHATSKIRHASDLGRIVTLGFRGEALPSIAAVSKMSFTTRTSDAVTGTKVQVEGGALVAITPAGCPPGATVKVKDLFYNTPARRKTMKGPSSEGAMCSEIISRLALARPDVCFELKTKGRRVFYSPGSGNLIDSIIAVYGVQQAREMITVSAEKDNIKIEGFTGKPSLSRSTRNHICIIINGRYVRCPVLSVAVEEAYRTLLPYGRKPVAMLSLSITPELLDINVHPAKLEVRFLKEAEVVGAVINALREALRTKEVIPPAAGSRKLGAGSRAKPALLPITDATLASGPEKDHRVTICNTQASMLFENTTVNGDIEYINRQETGAEIVCPAVTADNNPYNHTGVKGEEKIKCKSSAEGKRLPYLNALAQLTPTYILAGGEDGLYIIDQHAAHERILYEEHMANAREKHSQYLLAPVMLELEHREANTLTDRILWFTDAGFVIEHFGGNTFLLRSVPLHFPTGHEKELFMDMLDYFQERGPGASRDEFCHRLGSAVACKNAIKAGDKLSLSAMDALLQRLAQAVNPFTCPHGRPTVIVLPYSDLEKRFKR